MTERESNGDGDYPDGSVGRYVREQWGAAPRARKTRPYVAPVEPSESGAEGERESAPDSSLPLRPGRVPEEDAAGDDDLAAWAERGRAVTAPPPEAPGAPRTAERPVFPPRPPVAGRPLPPAAPPQQPGPQQTGPQPIGSEQTGPQPIGP
ncbi:MAG: hypothetical protein NTW05_05520, partial [Pseudonocardiales bacterium]|nr:hypothetical protein [Pseudonocardiales bacterium]